MARIELTEGFANLHVGRDQVLTIIDVDYDEKFNKAVVTFEDEDHGTGTEQFNMGRGSKPSNAQRVARNIFSTLAKRALRDWDLEDIDPDDLVGQQVMADILENEGMNKDGEKRMYTHLRNYREAPLDSGEGDEASDDDDLFA